ncbi:MAG TPA: NUDIX hydrolase [Thermoanaerobaculia bacterium]|nr:NUDIX hydrolase [Thermoanaerobaculia bacterium]
MIGTLLVLAATVTIPEGYWPETRSNEILAKTETTRLAPDLSGLKANERAALDDLLKVGDIMQLLYEEQRHHQARSAHAALVKLHEASGKSKRTQNLLTLYRLSHGPIAATLDNKREAFLPVDPQLPGKNMYPLDVTKEELDAFIAANPARRDELLAERTVVRRASKASIERDRSILAKHPALRELHPELTARLSGMETNAKAFYAVPYSLAYADQLFEAQRLLMSAATKLEPTDAEFARYLRNRGRDLITNDYESGDASWVTGRFGRFNAQIGSYESYDDALYGAKAFHSMSILVTNDAATQELRRALGSLQEVENALPYESQKQVRSDIPVGVYEVVADFGQARSANTATILPNDPLFARRYGRTILLRENIMRHPDIFAADLRVFRAVTVPAHANDYAAEGNFLRTLWHEIGHYLGPNGDSLDEYADSVEEMKSDLVSLFALHRMKHPSLRAIQAGGIRRTLQNVKPRSDQPYQVMQLIQFNWFLDKGLLTADESGKLTIHYDKYQDTVTSLLREMLRLQATGDKAATAKFYDQWTKWTDLHEKVAARIREAQGARWRLMTYAAID